MGKKQLEIGVFRSIMKKNIRFNPRPFSNPLHLASDNAQQPKESSSVELHSEVTQKVDELLSRLEENQMPDEVDELLSRLEENQMPDEVELTPKNDVDLTPDNISFKIEDNI